MGAKQATGAAIVTGSSLSLTPDRQEAERFLTLLDEQGNFLFAVIEHGNNGSGKSFCHSGSLEEHFPWLDKENQNGACIFVFINETTGRKDENVTRIRAVFADQDEPSDRPIEDWPLDPHLVVETSPGKYHYYWSVDGLKTREFSAVQEAITSVHKTDVTVKNPARLMRLPGFFNNKVGENTQLRYNRFRCHIVGSYPSQPYSATDVKSAFPPLQSRPYSDPGDLNESGKTSSLTFALDGPQFEDALQWIPPDIDYPEWLAVGQGINDALPGERGFALWDTWSSKGGKYKPGECAKKWLSFTPGGGITKATVFGLAHKYGWRNFHGSTPGASSFAANTQPGTINKVENVDNPPIQAMRSRRIADMESKPIDWIWPDMLAGGKLHLIAGKGGRGKTTLLLNLAATVSSGGKFPCGHTSPQGRVLILSGEDGPEDTILPRLKLAEADSERCEILNPLIGESFFEVREHLPALEQIIVDCGDVRLLIFDPITAFIGDAENNSPTAVRSVLARLSVMAERTGIAAACISHMRKGNDGEADERVLGSGAWVHACRIVLGVTETEEHGLILGKLKTNISPREGVFPFELEPVDDPICKTTIRVQWGSPLPHKCYDEFKEVAASERGSKIAEATDFLTRHLSSGPVSYIFVDEKRKNEGITEPTLNRAAKELGVRKIRNKEIQAGTMWALPDNFQNTHFIS